jgi:hypothetical protein
MSCEEIAIQFNRDPSTIYKRLKDEDLRAVIIQGTKELAAYIPEVIVGYKGLIRSDNEKIKLEAYRDVLRTTGIMPTHTSNQFFVQINQKNVNLQQNLTTLGGYAEFVAGQAGDNGDYVEGESEDNIE